MADRTQSYKSHTRNFPLFHFVAFPILALNFVNTIRHLYLAPNRSTAWQVVVAFGLVAGLLAARLMALAVQDRVIRLEMQLRLMRVLPPAMHPQIAALKRGHFVALRFASDAELADLVREITEGRLTTPKDIKMRVKDWQADWLRA
jgi:Family of unknown function (DUF6526)